MLFSNTTNFCRDVWEVYAWDKKSLGFTAWLASWIQPHQVVSHWWTIPCWVWDHVNVHSGMWGLKVVCRQLYCKLWLEGRCAQTDRQLSLLKRGGEIALLGHPGVDGAPCSLTQSKPSAWDCCSWESSFPNYLAYYLGVSCCSHPVHRILYCNLKQSFENSLFLPGCLEECGQYQNLLVNCRAAVYPCSNVIIPLVFIW